MSKADKKRVRIAFRIAVFYRDGYRCLVCGTPGTDETLDPHHVTDRNQIPHGGYVAENGITLCKRCHEKAEAGAQGFEKETLYRLIDSSLERAMVASERLGQDG